MQARCRQGKEARGVCHRFLLSRQFAVWPELSLPAPCHISLHSAEQTHLFTSNLRRHVASVEVGMRWPARRDARPPLGQTAVGSGRYHGSVSLLLYRDGDAKSYGAFRAVPSAFRRRNAVRLRILDPPMRDFPSAAPLHPPPPHPPMCPAISGKALDAAPWLATEASHQRCSKEAEFWGR